MHFSNAYGALPLATGNKTESACGYFTHFDMNLSFAPLLISISDRYSTSRCAASYPRNIVTKRPSAELAPDQFDEDNLLPYAVLDPMVQGYVEEFISDSMPLRVGAERGRDHLN